MAWRMLDNKEGVWSVGLAVERRAGVGVWQLMLSFRSQDDEPNPAAFWVPYPLQSASKSSLYARADTIRDDELHDVLEEALRRRMVRQ